MNEVVQVAEAVLRNDLVVLEEKDCPPFNSSGGAMPFHLSNVLYEQTSVMITTSLRFRG